jgi:GalNAc-alpha-(1->4)-GalNAc-alpha-(1->3)-diNAcBac-PP-undecaprenol alpha-1,4-N-acetyl-D-galactosaminyltransferase
MRLTLVISSLACGGAERVMTVMANYWAARAWHVTLLTLDDGTAAPFYDVDYRVRHSPLGLAGNSGNRAYGLRNNVRRVSGLRRAIRNSRPDAVISFIDKTNVVTLLAAQGLNVPVIVSEHTDPFLNPIGGVWKRLRGWTYPLADMIVVLSETALDYFPPRLQSRTRVIPNPVSRPVTDAGPRGQLVKPSVVAMGRLSREKGFDLLLRAFARVKDSHREWSLTILGEGPLRAELESLRDGLGLAGSVHLPGRVKRPHEVLAQGELFVMPSRREGFPMALCEAMACGLPVVCADCSGGLREIVRSGIDGLLVPAENADALAAAMGSLMRDESERKRLASGARHVTERFGVEKVMGMWEEALERAGMKTRFGEPSRLGSLEC